MFEIVISPEELETARLFTERVVSTVTPYYQSRNQYDIETIKHQTLVGKLGEFGARSWLIRKGFYCSAINFEVTYHKTFEADIIIQDKIKCHVKSQDILSAQRFGTSWTFQFGGGQATGHRDREIFDKFTIDDKVVFCLVDIPKVYICAQLNVFKLHELNLFGEPKKQSLRGIKKVVYFESIPHEFRVN